MHLKNDKIVVTIKGITFRSFRTSSTEGQFILDPTALTGWTDGTNVRRAATVRPVTSGDFTEPYTFSARLISISGTAVAANSTELQSMRDNLIGMLSENEYASISVETSTGVRYATVGLEGKPEWVQQLDNVAVFRVEFYAPDPYLYGVEKKTQAGAYVVSGGLKYPIKYPMQFNYSEQAVNRTVTNEGNAISYPKFVAVGDFYSGFKVFTGFGGKVVTYTGMVTKQSPVTIDMAKGTATQNGVDKTTLVTDRQWFGIPPQTTIFPSFDPIAGNGMATASGWCDIIYRDTWI